MPEPRADDTVPAIRLSLLNDLYAVCRMAADAQIPARLLQRPLVSITRTDDELSLLLPEQEVQWLEDVVEDPSQTSGMEAMRTERGFAGLRVEGPLDFSLVGILAHLTGALAKAAIPVFALSTFDTDYLFVRDAHRHDAVAALRAAGCVVTATSSDL